MSQGLRILYIEDDAEAARRIQQRLEHNGFRVEVASNGEAALIMMRVREYDFLLIAQELPVRSGLDVVWSLHAKNSLLPTIMLAANGDAEVAVQSLKLGVGDYMIKDRDLRYMDILPGCIHRVIEQRRQEIEKDRLLAAFRASQQQLEESNQALLRLAAMDGLTGIANRRLFDEILEREWQRGIELGTPLSLVLMDVDQFKAFNDIYGHLAGDDCLRKVAKVVSRGVERPTDLAARYGGEEFAVILPNRSEAEATRVAETIRRGVEALGIPHRASQHNQRVTISLGVMTRLPSSDMTTKLLIESTDALLYKAKESGRNWIVSADLTRKTRRMQAVTRPPDS